MKEEEMERRFAIIDERIGGVYHTIKEIQKGIKTITGVTSTNVKTLLEACEEIERLRDEVNRLNWPKGEGR